MSPDTTAAEFGAIGGAMSGTPEVQAKRALRKQMRSGQLSPMQFKLFWGANELKDAITHSHDVKRGFSVDDTTGKETWTHEPMDKMWGRKLAESKAEGLHSSILENGFNDSGSPVNLVSEEPHQLVGGWKPRYEDTPQPLGLRAGDGQHRIAAAADIETTTGRNIWITPNYSEGTRPHRSGGKVGYQFPALSNPPGAGVDTSRFG
jgi:hypothetical protein